MKQSIEWHSDCLKNSIEHARRKREILERDIQELEKLEHLNRLKAAQISLAIKEGKDAFDEERYAINRLNV